MLSIDLDPRQWNMIKAALVFWKGVAEHSRQHPSRYPGVEGMFKQYGPLSLDEIDTLLAQMPPAIEYVQASTYARSRGYPKSSVVKHLSKVDPVLVVAGVKFYDATVLDKLAKKVGLTPSKK